MRLRNVPVFLALDPNPLFRVVSPPLFVLFTVTSLAVTVKETPVMGSVTVCTSRPAVVPLNAPDEVKSTITRSAEACELKTKSTAAKAEKQSRVIFIISPLVVKRRSRSNFVRLLN